VRDGEVVKGVQFRRHRVVGGILELTKRYCAAGADELVFYDITASPDNRSVDRDWILSVGALLNIPFCVAGGIRSVADAESVLNGGADKISINSPALERPELITELAKRFGSQCVVIGIDSRKIDDNWKVFQYTGDEQRSRNSERTTRDWVREVQERGAGEIVLNCMNQDGERNGFDIDQLISIQDCCDVPLIASGGAGSMRDFEQVFSVAGVSAALAASVFHNQDIAIPDLKRYLDAAGIEVRL